MFDTDSYICIRFRNDKKCLITRCNYHIYVKEKPYKVQDLDLYEGT